jgi:hypothetical protein
VTLKNHFKRKTEKDKELFFADQISLFLADDFQFFSLEKREVVAEVDEAFKARTNLQIRSKLVSTIYCFGFNFFPKITA